MNPLYIGLALTALVLVGLVLWFLRRFDVIGGGGGSGPKPPAQPPMPPEPVETLFLAGLACSWPKVLAAGRLASELDVLCRLADARGKPRWRFGVILEVAVPDGRDWKPLWRDLSARVREVVRAARARGLRVQLFWFNSNGPGKGLRGGWNNQDVAGNVAEITATAKAFVDEFRGDRGILVCPIVETDSSTNPAIQDGVNQWWAAHWPHEQLAGYEHRPTWSRWVDKHPQSLSDEGRMGGDAWTLCTSDSGIIGQLFDGGYKPNARAREFVQKACRGNASVSLFNVSQHVGQFADCEPDYAAVLDAWLRAAAP